MAVVEGTWRYREACVEAKRSREGSVSVRGYEKKLDGFTPEGYLGCMLNGRVFLPFARHLYIGLSSISFGEII